MLSYRQTAGIFITIALFGTMHAMNHHTFKQIWARVIDDMDKFLETIMNYLTNAINILGVNGIYERNEFTEMIRQYEVLEKDAQPLVDLFTKDLQILINRFNSLEIIELAKKLLYAYFRQSAINIIDHLKRVYELN